MLYLFSLGITFYTAYRINRLLKYRRWLDWLFGFALIVYSLIVFEFTTLGFLNWMNKQWVVILGQVVLLVISVLLTSRSKDLLREFLKPLKQRTRLKDFSWFILIFAGLMLVVLLLNIVYVLYVPPSNNDALMIHLARVGMWNQNGTWLPFDTPAVWQNTFPFNGELMAFWSLLFMKRDTLVAVFPLVTGILSAVLIYQLTIDFFHKKNYAMFAALVWLSFPVIQLNLTSSRHDHISTFLLMAAFYFFTRHFILSSNTNLVLIGLSLGLSVGTNLSVAPYLLGFLNVFLISWLILKKLSKKDFFQLGIYCGVSFLLLSSPIFISNIVNFGSPLGPDALSMTSQESISEGSIFNHVFLMNGRWSYQMIDCEALPEQQSAECHENKKWLFTVFSSKTGISFESDSSNLNQHRFSYAVKKYLSEDSSWFGITGGVVFFTGSIFVLIKALQRKDDIFIYIAVLFLTTMISTALVRAGWTPNDGRYFAFLMALLCFISVGMLIKLKECNTVIVTFLMTLLSVVILWNTIDQNPAKSVTNYREFWRFNRTELLTAQSYYMREAVTLVEKKVPQDATLGFVKTKQLYADYGFFGKRFSRIVIPVYPLENLCREDWMQQNNIEYILLNDKDEKTPQCQPDNFRIFFLKMMDG